MARGPTSIIKKSYVRSRIENVKAYYDSNVESLIKTQGISPEEAADLSITSIEEAQARSLELRVANDRKSQFAEIQQDAFNVETKQRLAEEESARSYNIQVLKGFTEVELEPTVGSALLANAASEAQFTRDFENEYGGTFRESRGELNRTVGIFPKENRQASLVIKTFPASKDKPGSNLISIDEFFLTQVSEPSNEKYQIYQTFDQDFIFFYDRNPHVYVYSGVLINAEDNFEWRNRFQHEYERLLRGTKCVENGARAILSFENVIRQGYLLDLNMQNTSNNPLHTPFSFTFFVIKEANTNKNQFENRPYDELVTGNTGG